MLRSTIGISWAFLALIQGAWVFEASAAEAPVIDSAEAAINSRLSRFAAEPARVFNEPLERWREDGQTFESAKKFSPQAIQSGAALKARDQDRAKKCMEDQGKMRCLAPTQSDGVDAYEVIRGKDRPEGLVDGGVIGAVTLDAIERLGLKASRLSTQPWSDDYWGLYKGILGARYADPAAIGTNFRNNYNYVKSRPASKIVASGNAKAIDALSPSEKYELLIGDGEGGLTARMWATSEQYASPSGVVEDWMGICHGWAPAAYMVPRPAKSAVLKSADGKRDIKFYPSDLKALSSLLWAYGNYPIRFVGGRCNTANPKVDANGRVIDGDCFDTNPATWHLAVTQQIGVARKSFVFDATFDYEVWNQPVVGYTYRYFNPQSGRVVKTLSEAQISKAAYTKDLFKAYRAAESASIVGIVMDMTYVAETDPSHAVTDKPSNDLLVTVRYFYDLELDSSGKLIGGEWHTNKHPDFLWTPPPGARAQSIAEDDAEGEWTGQGVIPASWRKAAIRAQQSNQPLAKLVEAITRLAQ